MTPREFNAKLREFAKSIGGSTDIFVSIGTLRPADGPVLTASIYPTGLVNKFVMSASADDFDDLLDILKGKWADYLSTYESQTVRKIALEIIRITAESEFGCSDAALRQAGIMADDVVRYGAAACLDADKIASNGPFSIRYGKAPNE